MSWNVSIELVIDESDIPDVDDISKELPIGDAVCYYIDSDDEFYCYVHNTTGIVEIEGIRDNITINQLYNEIDRVSDYMEDEDYE